MTESGNFTWSFAPNYVWQHNYSTKRRQAGWLCQWAAYLFSYVSVQPRKPYWRGRIIKIGCFVEKEKYSFSLKSSWSNLVSTRRSTVLILPLSLIQIIVNDNSRVFRMLIIGDTPTWSIISDYSIGLIYVCNIFLIQTTGCVLCLLLVIENGQSFSLWTEFSC